MISAFIQEHRAGAAEREARAQRRRDKARESALKLPRDDRIQLIELLIDSLISKPIPDADLIDADECPTGTETASKSKHSRAAKGRVSS